MMKKIYTLLLLAVFSVPAIYAQTVTINENPTGTSPNIVFGTLAFHVSEYLYRTGEIGDNSFTVTPISKIAFNVNAVGAPTAFNNVNIYMRDVPTTTDILTTGTYSTAGYTLVFSGTVDISATGFNAIDLATPFTRTAGNNLEVLIERTDGAAHTGFVFIPSLDDPSGVAATTVSRRYNGATAATGTTSLTASTFRAAIQLIGSLPTDAALVDITVPGITCFDAPLDIAVTVRNTGTDPIAAGAASVTLDVAGANIFNTSISNTGILAPNAEEIITFSGVSISTPGTNDITAFVNLTGDGDQLNDSLFTGNITAETIATFPAVEDAETTLPVFSFVSRVAGASNLWTLQEDKFGNDGPALVEGSWDLADSLAPHGGHFFYLFDSYNVGPAGNITRLFSNCLTLASAASGSTCTNTISFWMSHDSSFAVFPDSLFLAVTTDKGATWTRLQGFGRFNASFLTPGWRQETVDLSAFSGQTVQLGFEGQSEFGNAIGLDDIEIVSNCVVPVTLTAFTAQKQLRANKLTWKTSQETNSLKYVVQQSKNGREFITLGEVAAAGNSNTERTYNFTHSLPERGFNYYRIKMVDIDGRFTYSTVRSLQNLGANEISSYPNPVKNSLTVNVNAEKSDVANVLITDMSGKVFFTKVYSVTEGDNNFNINTAGFTAGNYIIKVQLSGDVVVKKFSKL